MTERPGGPIDTCELGLTLISLAKEFEVKVNNQIGHATRTQIWVTTALKSTLQRLCEIEDAELPTNLLNTLKAPGVITNHNTITWPAEHHSKAMSALMKVLEILNAPNTSGALRPPEMEERTALLDWCSVQPTSSGLNSSFRTLDVSLTKLKNLAELIAKAYITLPPIADYDDEESGQVTARIDRLTKKIISWKLKGKCGPRLTGQAYRHQVLELEEINQTSQQFSAYLLQINSIMFNNLAAIRKELTLILEGHTQTLKEYSDLNRRRSALWYLENLG